MSRVKVKSFLLGSVLGGLVGMLLKPRRRQRTPRDERILGAAEHPFGSAPCYVPDDRFT